MPATINFKLTDAGKAAAVNADANGLQAQITHMCLGTGKYNSAAVGAGMTTMAARKEKVLIGAGIVTGAGGFRVHVMYGPWGGTPNPYDASEAAFYLGDPDAGGVLFAIYSHPSENIVQRNSLNYVASFNLQVTDIPPDSITIVVDPDASQALALIAMHEGATNPHPVYVRKAGDTSTGPQLGVTAPQHDNGKAFTTSEFVKRVGLSFPASGSLAITANTILTAAEMGRWADLRTNGVALTLPLAADCPVGASMQIRVTALSGLLVAQTGDVIASPIVGAASALQVIQGETITVTRNAPGVWEVLGTSFRMQAGAVSYFAGNTAPPGWLKLNGSLLSRAGYPALWQYAQSQGVVSDADWMNNGFVGRFSSGIAGNDFRIPDARGTFLRALDDGRGLDVGRSWGTYQDHANRSHNHAVIDNGHAHGATADTQGNHAHNSNGVRGNGQGAPGGDFVQQADGSQPTSAAGAHNHIIVVNPSTTGITIAADGSEARPRNIAWSLCVKF